MDKGYNISSVELFVLTFFLSTGLVFFNGFKILFEISGIGTIISIILGILYGFINLLIYSLLKNKKIPITLKYVFLTPTIIYSLYYLTRFIKITYLPNVNFYLILLSLILVIIYIIKIGIETISRSSLIFLIIIIIIFLFNSISLSTYINIDNLKPFGIYDFSNIIKASFTYYIFTLPIYFLLFIPKDIIIDKKKYKKSIVLAYITSSVFILITFFITESVMGINTLNYYDYPFYIVIRKINYFSLLERLENIISFGYLYIMFLFTTISSYILIKE